MALASGMPPSSQQTHCCQIHFPGIQCFFSVMTPHCLKNNTLTLQPAFKSFYYLILAFLCHILLFSITYHTCVQQNESLTFFSHVLLLFRMFFPNSQLQTLNYLEDLLKYHFFYGAFLDLYGQMSFLIFWNSIILITYGINLHSGALFIQYYLREWNIESSLGFLEGKAVWDVSLVHLLCVTKASPVPSSSLYTLNPCFNPVSLVIGLLVF